jgi:hypothetical protein
MLGKDPPQFFGKIAENSLLPFQEKIDEKNPPIPDPIPAAANPTNRGLP